MPRNGYPFEELFLSCREHFAKTGYAFVRERHSYFGIRREVTVFGQKEYAYVYVDHRNADRYFQNWMCAHEGEFEGMTLKEKDWVRYKGGFFILVSNEESDPKAVLEKYFGRTQIECVFKTGKEYLGMFPLCKQNADTVNGKLMQDMIDVIVYTLIREVTVPTGRSVTDYICDLQGLSCYRYGADEIRTGCVNRQSKEAYALFGFEMPRSISVEEYRSQIYLS